ncbi:VC0807 family protein [Streptomyces sp. NPDC002896]|uniref:VC0807 family protein n=1 Tax=Streptomyces sp. NPDC002896 TaxID=3154438 RepID=UPI0033213DBB
MTTNSTPEASAAPTMAPASVSPAGEGGASRNALVPAWTPLVVDVGLPLGGFYLLSDGFGVGTVTALAISSIPPALSALWTAIRHRKSNGLAALMLAVNLVGIALSTAAGDARLMLAKDAAISSVIGIAILVSVATARPLMSTAMKPVITKGDAAKLTAWDRLSTSCADFRTAERHFSTVWGLALLGEAITRVVCAYTLPVHTVVSLHVVLVAGAIVVAIRGSKTHAERIGALLRRATEKDA